MSYPTLKKKLRGIPIPGELFVLIIATVVFTFFKHEKTLDVGSVPNKLPQPALPCVTAFNSDTFTISLLSYVMVISLARQFGTMESYPVHASFEAFAIGMGNLGSSLFTGLPVSASLGRSSIQHSIGAKSQLASVISCILLIVVIYGLGEHFHVLPKAILASIVIVNLRRLYSQIGQVAPLWRSDRANCLVWMVTFCSVILFGILIGFMLGCGAVIVGLAWSSTQIVIDDDDDNIVKVHGSLTYLTIDQLAVILATGDKTIDLSGIGHIDSVAQTKLKEATNIRYILNDTWRHHRQLGEFMAENDMLEGRSRIMRLSQLEIS